ncbi:MAG: signal recognition particle-docking protein FtsY [Jiangellaceae bacterium]
MEYLIIGAVVAVVLGVAIVAYVVPRRRAAPPPAGQRPSADTDTDTATETAVDITRRDLEAATLPDETVLPEAEHLPPPPERPEPAAGRLVRLRSRLAGSRSALGQGLLTLLSRERLDDDTWQEIEDTLLTADLGVAPALEMVGRLQTRVRVEGIADPAAARGLLREELLALVDPSMDRSLRTDRHVVENRPAVVLVVGVNGTGKTTTVGKLARMLVAEDRDVVLGAADTFRAAAADQLTTWGDRVGVPTVRGPEGSDPASVAFDAVRAGIEQEADVVLVDTAGRLQTKVGLMDELGKVKRVIEKQGPVDEVLLVLDATTGQNGMAQARVFREVVDVTGIVLTKLDGTAKGGIVVAVQRELGVPVKLVGLGEGADDLAPFDPEAFVDGLLG